MAASKLSPQERLMRKRNAARLRQQRCRARKRHAMMERANRALAAVPKTPPPTMRESPKSPPKVNLPPRKLWKSRIGTFNPQSDYLNDESITIRPRVISFDNSDSVRSRASSFDSLSCSSTVDTTEDRQVNNASPASSVDYPSPVNFVRELPNKEEDAINAMLSLKSSSPKLCRPVPKVIRAPVVYANCWNPMVYQSRPRLYLPNL